MNKNIPKRVKKMAGAILLSGIMAFGAFSFLKTSVISTNKNIISATDEEGTIGNALKMEIGSEQNMLTKHNALPQTKEEAIKETPYTFTITNTGSMKQVSRLTMSDIQNAEITSSELPKDKINVFIQNGSGETVYEGTLAEIETSKDKGFGECFVLAGTPVAAASEVDELKLTDGGTSMDFKVFAWIDENVTNEELWGAEGTETKSIEFKLGALGVQYDGLFTADDESNLETKFEQALTGAME